jgi:hypothetical protein
LIWSIAALTANNGRIVFSLAVATNARPRCRRARLFLRAPNAWSHGSSSGAIATIFLPVFRFCRLHRSRQAQWLIQPSSIKAAAPFQRGVAASIGKSTD